MRVFPIELFSILISAFKISTFQFFLMNPLRTKLQVTVTATKAQPAACSPLLGEKAGMRADLPITNQIEADNGELSHTLDFISSDETWTVTRKSFPPPAGN